MGPPNIRHGAYYEGLVATRAQVQRNISPNAQMQWRSGHIATDDIRALKIAIATYYHDQLVPQFGGQPTVTSWSLEYPSGVFTQGTIDGKTSYTQAAATLKISDYVRPPVIIPRGANFWIRAWQTSTDGLYYNTFRDAGKGDLLNAAASGLTDVTMGGSITNAGTYSCAPAAIIGMTNRASVLILGPSEMTGYLGDTTISDGRVGSIATGFPADALAFANFALRGESTAAFISYLPYRQAIFPYCSHVVWESFWNDVINDSAPPATIIANHVKIAGLFPKRVKKYLCTTTPNTTSTDSWATTVNQTIPDAGNETNRTTNYNDVLRAGGLANIDAIIDLADAGETSRNSGRWFFPGKVSDQFHPNQTGYAAEGAALYSAGLYAYP